MIHRPHVIIDCETTGLCPARNELLEVSAVRWDPDRSSGSVGVWSRTSAQTWKFRPVHIELIDPGALRVNGYTPQKWCDSPHPLSPPGIRQYQEIVALLKGAYVVGHNVGFDLAFLRSHLKKHGHPRSAERARAALSVPSILGEIDTIALCWLVLGEQLDRLSLDHIRHRIPDIAGGDPHTSMGDVRTVEALLGLLCSKLKQEPTDPR